MYERILVPLDGSKTGEAALHVVEGLVPKISPQITVEVTLLQVITSLTHWVVAGEASAPIRYTENEVEYITKKTTEYLDKAGECLKEMGATVKTRVSIGNAAEEIVKVADEINADRIAMSTHGRTGFSLLAFGSVTVRVIRQASMPVLIVRSASDIEEE